MITSAKYSMLHPPLVERIYNEEKDEKKVKTRLHQMFGAYVQGNAHKKTAHLLNELEAGRDAKDVSAEILQLHASSKERSTFLQNFHDFIHSHVGEVETILDLGCGFNPFSIPLLPYNITQYHAYDIDTRTKDLLNRFLQLLSLPQTADCADLAVETPTQNIDLVFMCKLVPVLEMQQPGRGFEIARQLNAKFLVITYPLKSLGGRSKGMGKNYAAQFENAHASGALGSYKPIAQQEIGNELVYILKKGQ